MPTAVLKPKRSSTPSAVPTTSTLADGEMAVNTADQAIYVREGSTIVKVADVGGGGGGSSAVPDFLLMAKGVT